MGMSLEVHVAVCLDFYVGDYAEERFFTAMAEELGMSLSDDDSGYWIENCFLEHLGLPPLPEVCPEWKNINPRLGYSERRDEEQRLYEEWKQSSDGVLYNKLKAEAKAAIEAFGVDDRRKGAYDFVSPVFYVKSTYSGEDYDSCDVLALTPQEIKDAEDKLREYAKILKIDQFAKARGKDLDKMIGYKAWSAYW